MNYRFSEKFESFTIIKKPENAAVSRAPIEFPVGRTFQEYFVAIVAKKEGGPEICIDIDRENYDLRYTAIRTAAIGRAQLRFDTMELTLHLMVGDVPITLSHSMELSPKEVGQTRRTTSFRILMEGIVGDFLLKLKELETEREDRSIHEITGPPPVSRTLFEFLAFHARQNEGWHPQNGD